MVELQRPDGSSIGVVSLEEWIDIPAKDAEGIVPVRFLQCTGCGRRVDLPRPRAK